MSPEEPTSVADAKRARLDDGYIPLLPTLPHVSESYRDQIFRHKSLAITLNTPKGDDDDTRVDNERLSYYGNSAFAAAVTRYLYLRSPSKKFPVGYLSTVRSRLLARDTIASWSRALDLHSQLKHHSSTDMKRVQSAQIDVFQAYMAAIALDHGTQALEGWVTELLDSLPREAWDEDAYAPVALNATSPLPPTKGDIVYSSPHNMIPLGAQRDSEEDNHNPPKASQSSSDSSSPPSLSFLMSSPTPASVRVLSNPPVSPSRASSETVVVGKNPLSQLLEHAVKKGNKSISWAYEESGSSHAKQWTAHLTVGGVMVGSGSATTKQLAKSIAAVDGMQHLGWPFAP